MLLVTATTTRSEQPRTAARNIAWFFGLALALTWLLNNLAIVGDDQGWWQIPVWLTIVVVAMSGGPSWAGLLLAAREGRAGLHDLFGRALRWRTQPSNYVLAVGLPAIPVIAALGASAIAGEDIGALPGVSPEWWTIVALFLVSLPFAEEFGWRAYALPRLLAVTSPLRASIVLGAFWGLWHLPAAFLSTGPNDIGLPQFTFFLEHVGMWLAYLPLTISQSILMTWLFQRSRGSALIGGFIFHAGINAWAGLLLAGASLSGSTKDPSQVQLWMVIAVTAIMAAVVTMATSGSLGRAARAGDA